MTDELPPEAKSLYDRSQHPVILECIERIDDIAGYRLATQAKEIFLRFHRFITAAQPAYINAWRSNPATGTRYHRHANGILGDVQNTVACAYYHAERIIEMERRVFAEIERLGVSRVLAEQKMSFHPGNTLRWDFEYHAFVFAVRRVLDYLTRALAVYFRQDFHSFARFPKILKTAKPSSVAVALSDAHARNVGNFEYVISEGDERSIRDQIAHYTAVPVAGLNINPNRAFIAGGAEKIKWDGPTLSVVIQARIDALLGCVSDFLVTFEEAVRRYESGAVP